MTTHFSTRLRESTATIHSDVENRRFMVDLMDGHLDTRAYATLLTQYRPIYRTLEAKSRSLGDDAVFAPFADGRLERLDRIDHDLELLGFAEVGIADATERYVARLDGIARAEELLAHHYTRYLGDLSGGQAIGTLMARHYGIAPTALTMWDFTDLGKTKPYKDAYRRRLDDLRLTGGDEDAVIAETHLAFELNGGIFSEISALLPGERAAVTA